MASSYGPEQDKGYRRGFDQGFYAAMSMLSLDNKTVQDFPYKRRVVDWRYALPTGEDDHAPMPTSAEKEEIRKAVRWSLTKTPWTNQSLKSD